MGASKSKTIGLEMLHHPAKFDANRAVSAFPSPLIRHRAALALVFLSALPLLWPTLPPLVDLPNHLSRYRIALDYDHSALFRSWFEIRHVLVGNLGMDLLMEFMAPWFGLEPSAKFVIIAIPVLSTCGIALITCETMGRVSWQAALAMPLVYNYAFNFGFLNYSLSLALTLPAFGIWIRLGRLRRFRFRAALFVPIGFIIWLVHASGWGLLGLMVFGWEFAEARQQGRRYIMAAVRSGLHCAPLITPVLPMLLWSAHTRVHINPLLVNPVALKSAFWFLMVLDGHPFLDIIAVIMLVLVWLLPRVRNDLGYDPRLTTVGLVLAIAFMATPCNIIGATYADMRIAPVALMFLLLGLAPKVETRFVRSLAVFGWLFCAEQTASHTINYFVIAQHQQNQLEALPHLPRSTAIFSLNKVGCAGDVTGDRLDHLSRMAIVRRGDVTNGSWHYPATQTIVPRPEKVADYFDEDGGVIEPNECLDHPYNNMEGAMEALPRNRFRYLWLVGLAPNEWPTKPWLHRIWSNGAGAIFTIDRP